MNDIIIYKLNLTIINIFNRLISNLFIDNKYLVIGEEVT